ncbi:Aldehyde dehydrogenase [Entomortierella chlamydospora]|uniref:Aldehyde dehydrogenase n=1 Tax=Entomortierella chlamydospora TaxID=101097 RepID=A0A9P6MXH6_9FUNG|nr:Aldehyde dehydrogenase [Entomortierella chlamydospora]
MAQNDIPIVEYTPLSDIPTILQDVRATFKSGLTKSLSYRKEQLKGLHNMIAENEDLFREASFLDLRKPPQELFLGETGIIKHECVEAIKNLDRWASPEKVKVSLINKFDDIHIRKDPVGVVLIIGTWNYPVNLLLIPAIGAIAAGNTVILKPSEVSPHVAKLVTELLPKYLDQRSYRIVNGAVPHTSALLDLKFDHIFYTGSGNVGKIIMAAAAKQLTPVTLELGGKSPAFVAKDGNINTIARRLAIGKFFNSGQTCIAPDYVIVERGVENELVKEMKKTLLEFYGAAPQTSPSYGRIVSKGHFHRLVQGLKNTQGEVVIGGDSQEDDLFIAPTLVLNVKPDDSLMQDEIFGPILPIMVVDSMEDGVDYVNSKDQPLALYIFSGNKKLVNHILDNTRSGSAVVNETMVQFTITTLPFGGTGPSGIGSYHGKKSFDTFSHERSTVIKSLGMERFNTVRYPPYSEKKIGWLDWLLYSKVKYAPNAANPGASKANL